VPDVIMVSSDSELGSPQKLEVTKSSSDSEPGSPQLQKHGLSFESRYVHRGGSRNFNMVGL
jgi:hypothetical protein